MSKLWRILVGAIAVCAIAGIGPRALANDDVANFDFQEKILVGSVVLEPGSYTFRAVHVGNFMAVQVSNPNETTRYALVRARPEMLEVASSGGGDNLDVVRGENGLKRIVSWQLPDKPIRYVFEASVEAGQ